MRKAIFFDRDGTLNEFKLGDYIIQVEELVLLNGAARAVKRPMQRAICVLLLPIKEELFITEDSLILMLKE